MHPAFAPYARWLGEGLPDTPPAVARLRDWAGAARLRRSDGKPIDFAAARAPLAAVDYEAIVAREGIVPVREENWHDAFNALAWLRWPRLKAALNAIHVRDARASARNARSRARDAATLLDESGLVLACDDASLPRLLRAHAWRALFVDEADAMRRHCRAIVVGHGLLDKLRHPYRGITAKVLVVAFPPGTLPSVMDVDTIDAQSQRSVADVSFDPGALAALPVAALPGWDAESLGERLFDDVSVFRSKVLRSP